MSCPICSKDSVKSYRPFCSKRCADIDLAKWFNEGYTVPSSDPDDIAEAHDTLLRSAQVSPSKPH